MLDFIMYESFKTFLHLYIYSNEITKILFKKQANYNMMIVIHIFHFPVSSFISFRRMISSSFLRSSSSDEDPIGQKIGGRKPS